MIGKANRSVHYFQAKRDTTPVCYTTVIASAWGASNKIGWIGRKPPVPNEIY